MKIQHSLKCAVLAFSFILSSLCGYGASRAEMKIMCYNVMHCEGMDGRLDIERTAQRIKAEDPDFACLQEIDWRTARVGGVDEPGELARLTGMHATFAKAIFYKGGQYGVMMLSREKPVGVEEIPLPGAEPRVLLICEFKDCVIATSHLSVAAKKDREASVPIIRNAFAKYSKPVFFTGDWNARPNSEVLKEFRKFLNVFSVQTDNTFHGQSSQGPQTPEDAQTPFCIDYIAVDVNHADMFEVVDTHVVEDRLTSDHAPVVATVSFKAPSLPVPSIVPQPVSVRILPGQLRMKATAVSDKLFKSVSDKSLPEEGYRISISEKDGITIASSSPAGEFYAVRTIEQLATHRWGRLTFPCCEIKDWPRFGWRGAHIDDSRHFFGKAAVKRVLDQMAMHKLNVLHWHLTDSQGWRLPVEKYPDLVKAGAVRPFSKNQKDLADKFEDGMYGPFAYSREDIKEVVEYAKERFIRIVPEVDVPGHCRALLRAYPEFGCFADDPSEAPADGVDNVICVGNDRVLKMVFDVFDAVVEMFPGELIHIGGDEVNKANWRACQRCQTRMRKLGLKTENDLQAWFMGQIADYLAKKSRRAVGWDEIILDGEAPKGAVVMSWRGAEGGKAAAAIGLQSVMCPHLSCYFDYTQCIDGDPHVYPWFTMPLPLKKAYEYDPLEGIPAEQHKWILGGQCCNWSEYTCNETELQWKMWPRACATAEIFWSPAECRDWADFLQRMKIHRRRLLDAGINCAPIDGTY
jgi:endonuclease/exonuclease/phosphatase family metal-dependent hydrolase